MEVVAEAAMLILAMMTVGQQFVCIDDLDFSSSEYSGEYLTATMFGVGTGGFAAYIAGGKLLGGGGVHFADDANNAGLSKEKLRGESRMAEKSAAEMDALDQEARDFALTQPGWVEREVETKEERIARANALWAKGDSEFPGYEKSTGSPRAGADLILIALGVVQILNFMTGMGPPEEGESLKDGSNQFTAVSEQLKSAFPSVTNWSGKASSAYSGKNSVQVKNSQSTADLDRQLADCVKDQADWVNRMRLGFEILIGLALTAYVYEGRIKMSLPPPLGLQAAWNFACIASVVGVLVAAGMIATLGVFSRQNRTKADTLTKQYQELAADAPAQGDGLTSALTQIQVTTAAESTFSRFIGPGAASDLSATPPAAQSVNLVNGSTMHQTIPTTSTLTIPTEALATAKSGVAATLPGRAPQSAKPAQPVSANTQHDEETAVPAEPATLVGDATTEQAYVQGDSPSQLTPLASPTTRRSG